MKPEYFLMHGVGLVAVGEATLAEAQKRITGCSACSSSASLTFEWLLDHLFNGNRKTEYLLCAPIECPNCDAPILEKTLIDFDGKAALDEYAYFDTRGEDEDVVFIDEPTLLKAQALISACEYCCDSAEIPLDHVLDEITGHDPRTTEYVICHAAKCGACQHDVMEKTLIVPL